jgi:GNAT superfamily N-acetyltransferase
MYFHNFSSFIGKTGLYLEDIFIRPTYRGRGFGKAVLTYLAELAVKRNCWGMEWTCLDWNEPSIKFYESIGAVQNEGWRIYRLKGEALLNLSQN